MLKKILLQDVKSNKNGQIWGAAGDEVTIIRQDEELAIVELNGNRFSCRNEYLSDTKPRDIPANDVVQPKVEPVRKQNGKKSTAGGSPPSTNTLF